MAKSTTTARGCAARQRCRPADELRERYPAVNIFDIYEDIRTYGRGHEEYYTQASSDMVSRSCAFMMTNCHR